MYSLIFFYMFRLYFLVDKLGNVNATKIWKFRGYMNYEKLGEWGCLTQVPTVLYDIVYGE